MSTVTTTEYAGNFIYENNALQFFSQPEGYVEPDGSDYNYVYQHRTERSENVQWTFLASGPAGAMGRQHQVELCDGQGQLHYYPRGFYGKYL